MKARSRIREFWRKLDGPVHPQDETFFEANPDAKSVFHLFLPPPAFIGDVDGARVIVLMMNGNYKPGITESHFPDQASQSEYIRYIRGEQTQMPTNLAGYYRTGPLAAWLENGTAALVNAVAYRAPALTKVPGIMKKISGLPSFAEHLAWVTEDLIPHAQQGHRFLLVHRNGLWRLPRDIAGPNIIFSTNPVSKNPSESALGRIREWLKTSPKP